MRSQRRFDAMSSPMPSTAALKEAGIESSMNMTPMIDVMMALLIIMMVVTPILTHYVARTPTAANVVPQTEDAVVLGIDYLGNYYVGEHRIGTDQLAEVLSRVYAARPGDHLIYLRADGNLEYRDILTAIDAARSAGVRRIAAITSPIEDESDDGRIDAD